MINRRRNREIYPGIDNRFVICDVCGKKFRVKDTIKIQDRFNLLNNMIVCLADADKTNPQIKPIRIYEDLLVKKDYVRPESTFFSYTNLENEDTIGSAPRDLIATLAPLTLNIQLIWDGPLYWGNALTLGYRVYRADGVTEIYTVINSNTNSLATYYLDSSGDIESVYSYRVSRITNLGESPLSNIAYFPKYTEPYFLVTTQNDLNKLSATQNNYNLIIER